MVKQKIDYIHKNPINEGLAENPAAYPWSSWRAIYEEAASLFQSTRCLCERVQSTSSGQKD